jgi:hypothetical protein
MFGFGSKEGEIQEKVKERGVDLRLSSLKVCSREEIAPALI